MTPEFLMQLVRTSTAGDKHKKPDPTYAHALEVLKRWNYMFGDSKEIKDSDILVATIYAKLIVRCEQLYPEVFI